MYVYKGTYEAIPYRRSIDSKKFGEILFLKYLQI